MVRCWGGEKKPKTNPSLKLFSLETGRGDLGRVEVQGKTTWVVLLVPVLPAQGRGETLLARG